MLVKMNCENGGSVTCFNQLYSSAELTGTVTINLNFTPKYLVLYCVSNETHAIYFDIENSKIYATSDANQFEADITSSWLNTILSASGNTVSYTVPSGWSVTTRVIIC